jgi:FtsH-binding integral membrane protein
MVQGSDSGLQRYSATAGTTTLFGQTMWLVAATAGLFTLGAYIGRDLSSGWGLICFVGAFACLIGMNFAVRASEQAALALLFVVGLLLGLACAPTVSAYATTDPRAVWDAGGATALFVAACGSAGYAIRRDLSPYARILFWALLGLILFGLVTVFVSIPGGNIIYAVLGLLIFGGLTMFDFQRLRVGRDISSAPLLAASIFLDVVNIFLFFLSIFGGRSRD